jgi:hydrogenase large subunit
MATAHYLEALDFQKEIVKVHTIFGGKNPHPNWLVGGVPCAINVHDTGAVGAINMERLNLVKSIVDRSKEFVEQVYIPDLLAIASFYKGWLHGGGLSSQALLSYGDMPERANDYSPGNLLLPRGAIIGGKLDKIHEVDLKDPEQIQEFVNHSWYKYADESKGLHPFDGVTEPNYKPEGPNFKGTRTKIEHLDESAKYSWIKAPPALARQRHGSRLPVAHGAGLSATQAVPLHQGNHRRRAEEARRAGHRTVLYAWPHGGARHRNALLRRPAGQAARQADSPTSRPAIPRPPTSRNGTPSTWPKEAKGAGLHRGAARCAGPLDQDQGHQDRQLPVRGADHLERQPARSQGQIGAYEASLMNTPLAKADEPLEILRTLHSFDPAWPARLT